MPLPSMFQREDVAEDLEDQEEEEPEDVEEEETREDHLEEGSKVKKSNPPQNTTNFASKMILFG